MTRERANTVADHKLSWCHDGPAEAVSVLDAIKAIKPTAYLDVASVVGFRVPALHCKRQASACSKHPRARNMLATILLAAARHVERSEVESMTLRRGIACRCQRRHAQH